MRLLFVEDSDADVDRVISELKDFGFALEYARVDSIERLRAALGNDGWSAILAGTQLENVDTLDALRVVREGEGDLPFIVISGTAGEERAVDAIRAGANDLVMKSRLERLGPALERELRDVQLRQERRVLFAALRRAEDRYRRVFEKVPVGIAVSTPDGVLVAVNERFAAIHGLAVSEVTGRNVSSLGLDPHAAPGQDLLRQFVRGDGTVVWTRVSCAPVFADSGEIEQRTWLVEDVTAQKRYEAELSAQKEQLDEAQRMARIGSFEHDLVTGRRVWSDELYRIWGMDVADEPDPRIVDEHIHPADVDRVQATRRAILEMKQPFAGDHRIVLPGGEVRIVHGRGRFVFDENGRAIKAIGVVQDVTEARAQEEELERRAVQQALVANLGQAALSGAPVDILLRQATEAISRMLGIDLCAVLQRKEDRFHVVGGSGWNEAIDPESEIALADATAAAYTVRTNAPVIINDLAAETRFAPSEFLLRHGIVSGVNVPITSGNVSTWGVLGAYARERRQFSTSDVDFLRSVATVVGQAIERDRVDQQLVFHARQQSAIAELSRIGLTSAENAVSRACAIIKDILDVDLAVFLEASEKTRLLHSTAGAPTVPVLSVPLSGSHAGASLMNGTPVVIEDYSESVLSTLPFVQLGMTSGIAVPVASSAHRFGVLTAHAARRRRYAAAHVDLVQSLANILADALERELARRALTVSEQRYRDVVEGASEVIFTATIDGVFTSLNVAFENVTGWECEAWLGRSMFEMLTADEVPAMRNVLRKIIERRRSQSGELTVHSPNGMLVLELSVFPKVENDRLVALYGFARDVTEKKVVEHERQQLTRNLQLLLESTVEGIITADLEGICTMSNRAAAKILGLPPEHIVGTNLRTLLGPVNIGPIFDVARTGQIYVATDSFWNSAGTAVPVEYSVAPVIDEGTPVGVVISFSDITSRRKLEAKLEQADRLSSLGRLAATIAHEFNNVLMGISPFVEVMRRGRNIEAALDHVARAVKRGKRITEDILRFTQPAEPVRAAIDTSSWLDHVMLEARSVLPHQISLDWSVDPADLLIHGDANQLHQIFTNLILNARDAMPRGGLLSISVRRASGVIDHPERYAHFVVRDNGEGMSPETLRHIFEPLYTTRKSGTGLGLAVAHQVVQRHGGEIFVESTPGEGTAFHIFLPLAEENEILADTTKPASTEALRPRRILIVEDDESVASGLVTLLEMEGMHVDVATTGRAAIRMIETIDADVVLLDVGLPDMDGTAVYAEIAARRPDLPIIFSTGHGDRSKLPANATYLLKPYDSHALLEAIRAVV